MSTNGQDLMQGAKSFEQNMMGSKFDSVKQPQLTPAQYVEKSISALPVLQKMSIRTDYSNFTDSSKLQNDMNILSKKN